MSRRRVISTLACLLLLSIGVLLLPPRDRTQLRKGRAYFERTAQSFTPGPCLFLLSLPSSGEATAAVLNVGTNALPLMLKWTAYEIPTWRKKVNRLLSRLPVRATRLFRDRSLIKADAARQGFKILGPMAAPAIPELIEIAGKPGAEWSGQRAVGALSDIGAERLEANIRSRCGPADG